MSNQQMQTSSWVAPTRVQRTFKRLDDGRGGRAAALAEGLGVILDAAPKIVEKGSDDAFQEGMEARLTGVTRDNANTKNNSILGFMFSKQAQDGFDYQDAQMDLPILQQEELLNMEAELHDSRNPEDLRAYFAKRDQIVAEKLEGQSDFYKYAVAKGLKQTREKAAQMFGTMVLSNRTKDRAEAVQLETAAAMDAASVAIRTEASNVESTLTGNPKLWADAIAVVESRGSGDYSAKGRIVEKGMYAGDRAYGRYQVMGKNIPLWTKKHWGTELTPEQFLANPAAQDAVFEGEFGSYVAKYGNARDAASVWFTGKTIAEAGNPNDGGIDNNTYIARFDAAMRQLKATGQYALTPEQAKEVGGDWFGNVVKNAAANKNISPTEAKVLALQEAISKADLENDPALLYTIDPKFLAAGEQQKLADAIDRIELEKAAKAEEQAAIQTANQKAAEKQMEVQAFNTEFDTLGQLYSGEMTPEEAFTSIIQANPEYYASNPEARTSLRTRLTGENDMFTDPAQEATVVADFEDALMKGIVHGDSDLMRQAADEAIANARSKETRAEIVRLVAERQKLVDQRLFTGFQDMEVNITQAFPSGVGQDQSMSDILMGVEGAQYYPPTVDTDVKRLYRQFVIDAAADYFAVNPEAPRIPRMELYEMHQVAVERAIKYGQAKYGNPEPTNSSGDGNDPLSNLKQKASD